MVPGTYCLGGGGTAGGHKRAFMSEFEDVFDVGTRIHGQKFMENFSKNSQMIPKACQRQPCIQIWVSIFFYRLPGAKRQVREVSKKQRFGQFWFSIAKKFQSDTPDVGLEPTTTRLRALRSAD